MRPATAERLLRLNREFYQSFAQDFAGTRERLQPGVRRVLERLPRDASILDLGCGSGGFARALAEGGFTGVYLGLDFSPEMLEVSKGRFPAGSALSARFAPADLSSPDWHKAITVRFDVATGFAVLHHLPGENTRIQLLRQARALLLPGGRVYLSNWQFRRSPRFADRVVAWEAAGFDPGEVDPGDYLLDWRRGGRGVRYVHHFDQGELAGLARHAGLRVTETFDSDGREGWLSEYVVLEALEGEA